MFKNRLFSTIAALAMVGVGVSALTPNSITGVVQTAAPTVVAQAEPIVQPNKSKKRIVTKKTSRSHIRKNVSIKKRVLKYSAPNVEASEGESRPVGRNQRIGYYLANKRGWDGRQWNCLKNLWIKESGWSTSSSNSSGSAWGIPQALPGRKMASAGADWRTNPYTQIRWGLGYISGRYGSPCSAWAHWQSYNWY